MSAILLSACGDDGPESCHIFNDATYLYSYERISGDCATPPAHLGRANEYEEGCTATEDPRWSDNGCTVEEQYQCTFAGQTDSYTLITKQETDDGSRMSGVFTVSAVAANGNQVCFGTFSMSAVRQ